VDGIVEKKRNDLSTGCGQTRFTVVGRWCAASNGGSIGYAHVAVK